MARILFLTQVLPYPLDAGPKVRAYHMLQHLASHHSVDLVSFVRPEDPPPAIKHLRTICRQVHPVQMRRSTWRNLRAVGKGLLTGSPFVIARDEIGEMRATLQHLVREVQFDVVHADQLSMAGYGQLAARLAPPPRPHTLLDEHNAIHVLVRRMAAAEHSRLRRAITAREARAFVGYEAAMCRAYDAILAVSEQDRGHLLALDRAIRPDKVSVVPITVDSQQTLPVIHVNNGAPTILHLGTMFWPPNIEGVLWFAREVLPLIHRALPEARLVIIGKRPPEAVQALAADPRIEVAGYVADPTPSLAQSDVFVVPLHAGGGMRVKILDAWLWGLPVVTTPIGAEGINVCDGENVLIAADAPAFARATLRLLTDPELNQRLRTNGRQWVEARYAWQVAYGEVDKIYSRLLMADC